MNENNISKKKVILIVGIIIAAVISLFIIFNFTSIFRYDYTQPVDSVNYIPFITLQKGSYSDVSSEQTRIINSSAEWADLWTQMFPTQMIASAVDFEDRIILAAFLGQKMTGGYSVEIYRITETQNSLEVDIIRKSPGSNCMLSQSISSPYHIVELDRTKKKINFNFESEIIDCG